MSEEERLRKSENQSMRKSRVGNRYFRIDPGYDRAVYENTCGNWVRIIFTFFLFYIFVVFFWWACYSHGIRHVDSATWLYIGMLIVSWVIIVILIIIGHYSNKNLHKADRLRLEINEEKKKRREEEEKKRKREEAMKELKRQEALAMKDSLSDAGYERDVRRARDEDDSPDDQEGYDSESAATPSSEDE
ncbi:unnamed protein product [Moneuplotes crassus]|uniref:Uncharacterized protein n=1 Tax=Euplotes crassus TaxID=5936 RepID=A0AAD2D377_EUPCR|nr:unnamed protein product [Moneuplotes crassus]